MPKGLSKLSTASFGRARSRRRTDEDGPRPLPEYHVWDTELEQNVNGEAPELGEGVEGVEGERVVDREGEVEGERRVDGEGEVNREGEVDGEKEAEGEKKKADTEEDSSVNRVDSTKVAKDERTASEQEVGAPGSPQPSALAEAEKEPALPRALSPQQGIRWPRTLDEPETATASPRALTPAQGTNQPCSSSRSPSTGAENKRVPPHCLPPRRVPPLVRRTGSPTPSGSSIQLDRNRSRRLQRVERPGNIPVHCVVTERPKFSRERGVLNFLREFFQWGKGRFYQKINVSGHKNHQDPSPASSWKKIKLLRRSAKTPGGEEGPAQPRSGSHPLKKLWRTRSVRRSAKPPGEEVPAQPRSGYHRLKKLWRTRSAEKT